MVTEKELNEEILWVVDSGFAMGGLVINRGKIVDCAPIFRKWFLGRTTGTVKQIIRNKKGWILWQQETTQ